MGTKTITIMDDVYDLLSRNKRKDESFSDMLRKEYSKKGNILDLAGAWSDLSDKDALEMEKSIKKSREYTRKHVMERIK
ncbi:antitoxin VapB family protein [Candidatus Woesearchaeota archaeon]|nr:antitoxin VapB family protein [Candidatus Woesearchaeota archaeon]